MPKELANNTGYMFLGIQLVNESERTNHTRVKGLITYFFAHLDLSFKVVTNDSSHMRIYNDCIHDPLKGIGDRTEL